MSTARALEAWEAYQPNPLIPSLDRWKRVEQMTDHPMFVLKEPRAGETYSVFSSELQKSMQKQGAFRAFGRIIRAGTSEKQESNMKSLEWLRNIAVNGYEAVVYRYVFPGPTQLDNVWWFNFWRELHVVSLDGPSSWSDALMEFNEWGSTPSLKIDPQSWEPKPDVVNTDANRFSGHDPRSFTDWSKDPDMSFADAMLSNLPLKEALSTQFPVVHGHVWILHKEHRIHHRFVVKNDDAKNLINQWKEYIEEMGMEHYEDDDDEEEGVDLKFDMKSLPKKVYDKNNALNPKLLEWMSGYNMTMSESIADMFTYRVDKTTVMDFVIIKPDEDTNDTISPCSAFGL